MLLAAAAKVAMDAEYTCGGTGIVFSGSFPYVISSAITIIKIVVPVLLIIFGFVSLYCSSSSNYVNILYGMNGIYLFMMFDELFRGIFNY